MLDRVLWETIFSLIWEGNYTVINLNKMIDYCSVFKTKTKINTYESAIGIWAFITITISLQLIYELKHGNYILLLSNTYVLPNSCGNSWQKTATDVLKPLDKPSVKAAPRKNKRTLLKSNYIGKCRQIQKQI